jgi:hypothetical protein
MAEAFSLAVEYKAFSQDFIRGAVEQQGQLPQRLYRLARCPCGRSQPW